MIILFGCSIICILVSVSLFLYVELMKKQNKCQKGKAKKNPNVCILIPAKDESKVILSLLESIQAQTKKVPSKNVYVIVENEEDETVSIVKKKKMNYFVRKDLHLKTKGYALKEMIEYLDKKKKYYDCYFIFDADNILENNFIEEMLKDYQEGYQISTGYRAIKNKDSYFSLSAGLIFYLINEIGNKETQKHDGNILLSGTGYYIHGDLIKKWQTFPFHSLTEDYESSLYYTLEGISTHYNDKAKFYDEQPTTYQMSIKQRSRWIKGYFKNWFLMRKKMKEKEKEVPHNLGSLIDMRIGILPVIFLILGIIVLLIALFISYFITLEMAFFILFFLLIFLSYMALFFITLFLLNNLTKTHQISKKTYLKTLFFHPFFLLTYLHAFFIAIFNKNLGWEKIEHTGFNG